MDVPSLVQELAAVPSFELYRLSAAIHQLLDDPARITKVKARLQPGMTISWFDDSKNCLVEAIIVELRRTRLLVANLGDGKHWEITYASVNLEGVPVNLPAGGQLGRAGWKVGDPVAFRDKQNRDLYGTIVSLNPKTASVVLKDNKRWRVAYSLLIPVWEGEARAADFAPGLPIGEKTIRVIEACAPEEETDSAPGIGAS